MKFESAYFIQLKEDLKLCNKVRQTVSSEGWQEVIGPLIDKTIIDVVGGKIDGKWVSGYIDKARKDEKREYYIGYKQAMIDLYQRIYNYIDQIPLKEDEAKRMLESPADKVVPLSDSPYYPEDRKER